MGLVEENLTNSANHQNYFHTFAVEAFDCLAERNKVVAAANRDQIDFDKKGNSVHPLNSHHRIASFLFLLW